MSASVSSSRGGQPSTTTPTPPPWDSPHVVMRKSCPNVFAINRECEKCGIASNQRLMLTIIRTVWIIAQRRDSYAVYSVFCGPDVSEGGHQHRANYRAARAYGNLP